MKKLAVVVLGVGSGCFLDGARAVERPARFQLGLNTRQFQPVHTEGVAKRSATPTPTPPSSVQYDGGTADSAFTGSAQFTMVSRYSTYFGVEAEAGTLGREGSNFAAGYGIAGVEHTESNGSLGFEFAGGRRWLRNDVNAIDVRDWVSEGRVRARFWLSPQVSFGATIGGNPREESWMAGVSLSVYSNIYNQWDQR